MNRYLGHASWFLHSLGFALLALSLVLVPQNSLLADIGSETIEIKACSDIHCQTTDCYRILMNGCNKTGDECRQIYNFLLCGGCICTLDDDGVCQCK